MSKKVVTNTWNDGLNKDLNPTVTPNTVLTDNLNGTFVTYNGNELTLQNDMGNIETVKLTDGFYPIGIAEYEGIVYIASVRTSKPTQSTTTTTTTSTVQTYKITYPYKSSSDEYTIFLRLNSMGYKENVDYCSGITFGASPISRFWNMTYSVAQNIYNMLTKLGHECTMEIDSTKTITTNTTNTTTSSGKYAFEIGSFPSLDPSNATYTALENGEIESTFENKYRPLHNMIRGNGVSQQLCDFRTSKLEGYDLQHPVHIEIQPSYDGSVNLILSDDKNPIRLINSGFAVTENGKGKFVKRNQGVKTNYYNESDLDLSTKLIRTSVYFTAIDLQEVLAGGKLKGGNYTFYVRFGDEDGNKTDIVAESGIVSIFNGTISDPRTISGAFANEVTDKLAILNIAALDTHYSKLYISYTREYSDANGSRLTEACNIIEPYNIDKDNITVTITGLEEVEQISLEELNIVYHNINSAKTIAQQQNMLFLGNIETNTSDSETLQELSYDVIVKTKFGSTSIGTINSDYSLNEDTPMYYDPKNIYYNLGYWPNELYRFGIVYIKNDGSITSAYNLKGCIFNNVNETNWGSGHISNTTATNNYPFINGTSTEKQDNLVGVFRTPDVSVLNSVHPLCFEFTINSTTKAKLEQLGVIGYFIVRQKRLPLTICQGITTGINKASYYPVVYGGIDSEESGRTNAYWAQSFLTQGNKLVYNPTRNVKRILVESNDIWYLHRKYKGKVLETYYFLGNKNWPITKWEDKYSICVIGPKGDIADYCYYESTNIESAREWASKTGHPVEAKLYVENNVNESNRVYEDIDPEGLEEVEDIEENAAALISVEANIDPEIQSMLNGTSFDVVPVEDTYGVCKNGTFNYQNYLEELNKEPIKSKLAYIPEGTYYKNIDGVGFSNTVGDGVNPQEFGYIKEPEDGQEPLTLRPVRGRFAPYIAMSALLPDSKSETYEYDIRKESTICNIRIPHDASYTNEILARGNDNSPFYAVSNKTYLDTNALDVFRGDCYKCQVTVRMHRNFIDQNAPVAEQIVNPSCWEKWFRGVNNVLETVDEQSENESERKTDWSKINIGDLNTVALGHWITFTCLANTNLGLRCVDTTNSSEMALMGSPRSFYPLTGISSATATKVAESSLFNSGYNASVGRKHYLIKEKTPYDKSEFSTRIMFSNVSVTDSFINGYRVFQGLSYKDYTKQYGSIIKLLPWGNNLFVVFEHGLAIAPVNEKALLQTTTEQTIHIYGHGVLTDQLTIISQDFGSTWADSVIRTPIGIYGFDTSAKKIWRYTDNKGLEIISDLHIQRFLNDNAIIDPNQSVNLGITDVRTHYNNYKGDVMFVFYNGETSWNMCYNERQGLWVTRYSWTPLMSINVDNTFYSINKNEKDNHFRIFKHGRTGVDSEFRPCSWYGEQHPFEFEFVVKDPIEFHKIFDNLRIISNNVQPSAIEFEFVGDSYLFNRSKIYNNSKNLYGNGGNDVPYNVDIGKDLYRNRSDYSNMFYNARVNYDNVIDQYTLVLKQSCKNKDSYGVRLGNIQYKEDGWYTNIEPLRYDSSLNNATMNYRKSGDMVSTKIRDKWIKVRIIYTGDRLALINAVSTFETLSYA